LGFEKIFISKYNQKGLNIKNHKIQVIFVSRVDEVFTALFG
jgi:DNA repair protein RadA/Sms